MQPKTLFISFKRNALNTDELHIANVINDPEFAEDVAKIFPYREKLVLAIDEEYKGEGVCDWTKIDILEKNIKQRVYKIPKDSKQSLADKYAISLHDLNEFLAGKEEIATLDREGHVPVRVEWLDNNKGKMEFADTITKDEYLKAWEGISIHKNEKYKGKTPQPKLLLNDKLVYAIYKARNGKNKPTFLQIFWQYQEDRLPGYPIEVGRKTKQFKSKQSLESYYNKYKPKPKTNI